MNLERVYVPVWDWEENKFNMWGSVNDRAKFLRLSVELTGDHKRYGRFMMRVVNEWKNSCINALTDSSLNKKAWVGHAACALAIGCPEDITRQAWGKLTDDQRLLANREAERAIQHWERMYAKSIGLCQQVENEMLFD